jgi:chromosome segregation ATPase
MEEKADQLNENNFRLIRKNVEKITVQTDMRRKLIGGVSEEDVSKYIESVRQQYHLVEDELKKYIVELQSSKDILQRDFESYRQKSGEQKARLQEALEKALNDSSGYMNECMEKDEIVNEKDERYHSDVNRLISENRQLESKCDELEKKLLSFEQEIERLNTDTATLEETLKKSQSKVEEGQRIREQVEQELEIKIAEVADCNETKNMLASKVEELEKQLSEERKMVEEYYEEYKVMKHQLKGEQDNIVKSLEENANLNSKVSGFKNGIDAIYNQLNALNEQVCINENIQQQMVLERIRADNAEKDISQFWEWVSGLKDRFHKDHVQLKAQFNEIEEKHKLMQSDINALHTNLENFCVETVTDIGDLCATVENKINKV